MGDSSVAATQVRPRFDGVRAVVVGLAREGLDLTRFLGAHGAHVVVVDRKTADELGPQLAALADQPRVTYRLGGHSPRDLDGADVVFVSPGVPPENLLVVAAHERGIRVSSLVELFFELCPAPIVGVTGSAGKTTTTTLLGDIFRQAGRDAVVGGNIGRPLLSELERMRPSTWVVMELSSFQLEGLRASPTIAVITNVTPNHLDRHPSMEAYWAAKGHILAHQGPSDWAVLNADDAWSARYRPRGSVLRFSLKTPVSGAFVDGDRLVLRGETLMATRDVPLRGRHNVANVLAACAAAAAAGVAPRDMVAAVTAFGGVPHRLQTVGERGGVRFVDDSIATAPERSMAALEAFDEPLVLIAGGRDKHLPMAAWARSIVRRVKHVVLYGEMADLVAEAIKAVDPGYDRISWAETMDEAVAQASAAAAGGDVVLLSPGGTSYDRYRDFEERGADFARSVARHAASTAVG